MSWALNKAPVDESSAAFVLLGLANHAGPDGRGAFPSVGRLCSYTHLGERTVREYLDILEAAGIIAPCDPAIVAAWIKRADNRPQGWDLAMSLDRENPEHLSRFQAAVAAEKQKRKERRERLAEKRKKEKTATGGSSEVRPSHPEESPENEVRRSHLDEERGATVAGHGVRPSPERGATVAPEPYVEPSYEPSLKDPDPFANAQESAGSAPQQETLGGMPAPTASGKKPSPKSTDEEETGPPQTRDEALPAAKKLADGWLSYLKGKGVTVIDRSRKAEAGKTGSRPFWTLVDGLFAPALIAGADELEIKTAMLAAFTASGNTIPPWAIFERHLHVAQGNRSTAGQTGYGKPRTRVHIDNVPQEERDYAAAAFGETPKTGASW